jgi:hypothetical protein
METTESDAKCVPMSECVSASLRIDKEVRWEHMQWILSKLGADDAEIARIKRKYVYDVTDPDDLMRIIGVKPETLARIKATPGHEAMVQAYFDSAPHRDLVENARRQAFEEYVKAYVTNWIEVVIERIQEDYDQIGGQR